MFRQFAPYYQQLPYVYSYFVSFYAGEGHPRWRQGPWDQNTGAVGSIRFKMQPKSHGCPAVMRCGHIAAGRGASKVTSLAAEVQAKSHFERLICDFGCTWGLHGQERARGPAIPAGPAPAPRARHAKRATDRIDRPKSGKLFAIARIPAAAPPSARSPTGTAASRTQPGRSAGRSRRCVP